ncbi:hypothetical protein WMY93_006780 [Mugilogobius chulae]|uniref:Uncharacterized protein n=1 Tax=Mugilogobius chulae TaxID=88201 RepID=A0AAW0PLG8_9GOBI
MSGTRTNRLRRSVRQAQAAEKSCFPGERSEQGPVWRENNPGKSEQGPARTQVWSWSWSGPGLQTPARSRLSSGLTSDSSQNESFNCDFHQDIVWDTTSPSPHRLGKRGRRLVAGVVNISDIVNRIAPEVRARLSQMPSQRPTSHRRFSAAAVDRRQRHHPLHSGTAAAQEEVSQTKRVDDLLKLAKQFDFNMLHESHQDPDLNQDQDWLSDEDLDFLFDASTQTLTGALSQAPERKVSRVRTKKRFSKTSTESLRRLDNISESFQVQTCDETGRKLDSERVCAASELPRLRRRRRLGERRPAAGRLGSDGADAGSFEFRGA